MLVKKFQKALMIKINVSKDYVNINVITIRWQNKYIWKEQLRKYLLYFTFP
jgi:hypothetical protein